MAPGLLSTWMNSPLDLEITPDGDFIVSTQHAILQITAPAPWLPPVITTQPASQTVVMGKQATFTAAASSGLVAMTYQWSKNGIAITGATSASYTTPVTTIADSGSVYTVAITNPAGTTTSSVATLTVLVAPTITTQPAATTVNAGATATFSVVATGSGTLTYQWSKNGAPIAGATLASYTTPVTTGTDSGAKFTVVVSNSVGSVTSSAATLTVLVAPTITTQPANITVNAGATATFTVVATGSGTLSYQWSKNGAAISGATSASYKTPATTGTDSGAKFTVVVSPSLPFVSCVRLPVAGRAVTSAVIAMYSDRELTELRTYPAGTGPLAGRKVTLSYDSTVFPWASACVAPYLTTSLKSEDAPSEAGSTCTQMLLPHAP